MKMAAVSSRLFQRTNISIYKKVSVSFPANYFTNKNYSDESPSKTFLQKLLDISPHTQSHSKTLTQNKATYELQFEYVKPEFMKEYLNETASMNAKLSASSDYPGNLLGNWTTLYGDLDEAISLWTFEDGYEGASKHMEFMKKPEMIEYQREKGHWLRYRRNQLLQDFSFWGTPQPRKPAHIYELRSYDLKPGTLIEWGNKWGSAIQIRRKDAVGGFFSQIGELYQVHHIWAYNDLAHRKLQRENMWEAPGWDDLVAATVPLIRSMKARVLQPTAASPMQ